MMSAPRITPLAIATSAPMPETRPERTPVVIIGSASSIAFRASSSASSLMPERVRLVAGLVDRLVDRGADLVGLFGHAPHRRDRDAHHEGEQTEDDHAGGEAGLELVALERARPAA